MGGRKFQKTKLIVLIVGIIYLLTFTPLFVHQKQSHIHNYNEKRSHIPNNVVKQKVRKRFKYHTYHKKYLYYDLDNGIKGAVLERKCL